MNVLVAADATTSDAACSRLPIAEPLGGDRAVLAGGRPGIGERVLADNCTDATVEVARTHGVEVVETVGNTEKKAGALNQELARLLPER